MTHAFVIMQIGDAALGHVYDTVISPTIRKCGLQPRRIDQDNEGGLLNAEIMAAIEHSDILVADLTNERPNCYLEVGYALGLGRSRNLILTVRNDHLPGEPNHNPGGPKVHFDLAGYDLLLWDPDDLPAFAEELERRIRRRQRLNEGRPPGDAEDYRDWFEDLRQEGLAAISDRTGSGFMELVFELEDPKVEHRQADLLDAARQAEIRTFGWPIGIILSSDDQRPRPTGDGIRAVVVGEPTDEEVQVDLWELRTNGDYYLIQNLFEDQRGHPDQLFFDIRIVRVAEALLYCGRLYDRLGASPDSVVRFTATHGGLASRTLVAANRARHISPGRRCAEDQSSATVSFTIGELDAQLVHIVEQLLEPLFELFDFFSLSEDVYESIVDAFVEGGIS